MTSLDLSGMRLDEVRAAVVGSQSLAQALVRETVSSLLVLLMCC